MLVFGPIYSSTARPRMGADFDRGKTSRLHPAHLFPERKILKVCKEATAVSFEIEDDTRWSRQKAVEVELASPALA
jgi:hypothetical protein